MQAVENVDEVSKHCMEACDSVVGNSQRVQATVPRRCGPSTGVVHVFTWTFVRRVAVLPHGESCQPAVRGQHSSRVWEQQQTFWPCRLTSSFRSSALSTLGQIHGISGSSCSCLSSAERVESRGSGSPYGYDGGDGSGHRARDVTEWLREQCECRRDSWTSWWLQELALSSAQKGPRRLRRLTPSVHQCRSEAQTGGVSNLAAPYSGRSKGLVGP